MKTLLAVLMTSIVLSSCGAIINSSMDQAEKNAKAHEDEFDAEIAAHKPVAVAGYVVSAFQVNVDGESYPDLESFYTKELQRLPARLKAAGYDDSYKARLDAQVGFKDLWNRMDVYILATGKTGYQASTYVDSDGGFKVQLPHNQEKLNYKIRAVKRINILISKGDEQKVLCYNFSAKEQSVSFTTEERPVILNDFVSDITAYQCDSPGHSGLSIP